MAIRQSDIARSYRGALILLSLGWFMLAEGSLGERIGEAIVMAGFITFAGFAVQALLYLNGR